MPVNFTQLTVTELDQKFVLPGYQRGYRWGTDEVKRLLSDIFGSQITEGNKTSYLNYCLQPIVVKPFEEDGVTKYELVDGQQRLTTLYLINRYLSNGSSQWMDAPAFSITYATRPATGEYLELLFDDPDKAESMKDDYIDFAYLHNALKAIESWFSEDKPKGAGPLRVNKRAIISMMLSQYVKLLWYEADDAESGHRLFKRLNIGRIPLTNAELIKALFLNRESESADSNLRQDEIATQWDRMEKELHNPELWRFLTNENPDSYATRLELIFDFKSNKNKGEREKYYTFFYFSDRLGNGETPSSLWGEIMDYYSSIIEWYENRELYNTAGYLVAVSNNPQTLPQLLSETSEMPKNELRQYLSQKVKDTVTLGERKIEDLRYDGDYGLIKRILLWMNVATLNNSEERFPYSRYKEGSGWSLEHIHAQNSDMLNKEEQWLEWLRINTESLDSVVQSKAVEELRSRSKEYIDRCKIKKEEFNDLYGKFLSVMSAGDSDSDREAAVHGIGNLALLRGDDNSALNCSVFETKRIRLGELDSRGRYIPVCTRNVFTKYYSPAGKNQPYFWGECDRNAYIEKIKELVYQSTEK